MTIVRLPTLSCPKCGWRTNDTRYQVCPACLAHQCGPCAASHDVHETEGELIAQLVEEKDETKQITVTIADEAAIREYARVLVEGEYAPDQEHLRWTQERADAYITETLAQRAELLKQHGLV